MALPALAIPSFVSALFRPLAALWRWLTADATRLAFAIVIGLCAFLAWRLSSIDGDRDEWRDKAKAEESAHAETLRSVKTLRDALELKNAESLARAAALEKAREEAAQAQSDADRRYTSTQARIGALRAAVGKNDGGRCDVPTEVQDALAGL